MLRITLAATLAFFTNACANQVMPAASPPVEEAISFTANSGESVEAFRGSISVPENRGVSDSRQIKLAYVRFPSTSTAPGSPIVYLAGGPGGSGIRTAKGRRFPLFMAMREFGDVIALDQRGTGESDDAPRCVSSVISPDDKNVRDEEYAEINRQSALECAEFWRARGIDAGGYTTVESVDDLDALRAAFGADKISLWGISYGSHLAMAAIKRMDDRLDRVVIASAEGLDQTVKMPAETDAYFGRLQAAIDADPAAKAAYPDIAAMMRRVHAKLEAEPVMLSVPQKDGDPQPFLLTRRIMQMIASALIADPDSAASLMQLYAAADAGNFDPFPGLIGRFITPNDSIGWRVMPLTMDVASGISDMRLARVREQAKTSLIGEYLNFPMPQFNKLFDGVDLGDDFRENPKSNVPTLLLSGTLDGRTYPESQREALSGMRNLTTVTVVNSGHNLFMTSPEVTEAIQQFMRGEKVTKKEIVIDPPSFVRN
ncbi:alpha/beta fold hydrolase [Hyphococcus sp.]|uniref:alpha/beta fold hydrolase n=1 Tax=Hyphococcus sp. TaxID=2038636 RepID=UPI002080B4E5|nr:MAG: alpha/beta hydrolase [Marinicaulis sp.]